MKIIFASSNAGKITELRALLKELPLTIIPQKELNVEDIEETGLTFVENALLKARNAAKKTGLPAIADDSGLIIPALNGEPGLYSARYAHKNATAKENIEKVLTALKNISAQQRSAFFYCVLVFVRHEKDPAPIICEGKWQGKLLSTPQGENGFGYDPIFFDENEKLSAAELPLEKKNRISHRGKALQLLLAQLKRELPC